MCACPVAPETEGPEAEGKAERRGSRETRTWRSRADFSGGAFPAGRNVSRAGRLHLAAWDPARSGLNRWRGKPAGDEAGTGDFQLGGILLFKPVIHSRGAGLARAFARRFWLRSLAGCAACLLALAVARGQTTSSISGTVRDTTGALIPGARVVLVDESSRAERSTVSNGAGEFIFAAVQPGRAYDVKISMSGFEPWMVTDIAVHPGDSIGIDKIAMKVGAVTTQVTVSATAAGVALTSPERSELITSGDIARLSTVGRDVSELVKTLPGFTLNGGTSIQNQAPDYEVMGFGSGNLGSYGANGSAPQQGQVNLVTDSADVIDPGDMGGQIMNVNADQVQEVSVQTSNFGADEAKGPIVINAVGKSGGAEYHGSLYGYVRNAAFNANDWLSNYYGTAKPDNRFVYPGASIGGPVEIPGTGFNQSKKMTFWLGVEDYNQTSVNALAQAFIPNAAMLGGDFSAATLAQALNLSQATLTSNCTEPYAFGNLSNVGGICYVPGSAGTTNDENGDVVNSSSNGQIPSTAIQTAAAAAYTKFYPKINRVPQPLPGIATASTDGFNYVKNVMGTNNGLQIHSRVDENFTDNLKFYGTYNYEAVNAESPMNNIYYNPSGTIPYPTPEFSNAYSHVLSANLTRIFSQSLTNELVASGAYFYEPMQFANRSLVEDSGTGWPWPGGHLANDTTQLPEITNYQIGVPSFAMSYVPPGSEYLRKFSWNVQDTLSKQLGSHSIKGGIYTEVTANNQIALGNPAQGSFVFASYDYCLANYQPPVGSTTLYMDLGNAVADLITGCAQSYSQANADLSSDMNFKTLSFFGTDEWKLNRRITLTLGVRLEHLGPWTDPHGIGLAVWEPSAYGYSTSINGNDPTTWPGVYWHKHTNGGSIPLSGAPATVLFYSPRAGVAWDVTGDGRTVFRGGWGAYRSHDSYNTEAGAANTTAGISTYSIPGANGCTYQQLFVPGTVPSGGCGVGAAATSTVGMFSFYALDPHDSEQPVTYNYNLTLDRKTPWNSIAEVAYVGNQSSHLATLGNLENQNVVPLGAGFGPDPLPTSPYYGQVVAPPNILNWSDYRPYPNYTQVFVPNHIAWANYNALQTSWKKEEGPIIFNANYVWSKALGVRGNYDTGYIADPIDAHHDYGMLAFNRTQVFNLSYSWQEGTPYHGNRVFGGVANGWEISGIEGIQSGPDMAVINGTTNFSLSGAVGFNSSSSTTTTYAVNSGNWLGTPDYSVQPVVTCNPKANLHSTKTGSITAVEYINGNCFALPAMGRQGWWNLPDVHGPAFFSSDLTVFKDFKITERQSLQFKVAGFDFLNHPLRSFNNNAQNGVDLVISDPSGQTFDTLQAAVSAAVPNANIFGYTGYKSGPIANGPGRIVELGVKYTF